MMLKNIKKHKIITVATLAAFIIVGYFFYNVVVANNNSNPDDQWVDGVNYRPPTEEEARAGDQRKEEIDQEEDNNKQNQSLHKAKVEVIITDAGQYGDKIEVRSFVPDYYEEGTCTISLTKDANKITKTAPAHKDISSTICTNPDINRSEFPETGLWQVKVGFDSPNATGTSESQQIEVR